MKTGHRLVATVEDGYDNIASAGSEINKITSFQIVDSNGQDVTSQYEIHVEEGKSTILKRKLTIKTASATKVYDGTPLSCNAYWITRGFVAPGHSMQIIMKDPPASVGSQPNQIAEVIIRDLRTGKAVDHEYEITFDYGTLAITSNK